VRKKKAKCGLFETKKKKEGGKGGGQREKRVKYFQSGRLGMPQEQIGTQRITSLSIVKVFESQKIGLERTRGVRRSPVMQGGKKIKKVCKSIRYEVRDGATQ